ncbi:DUF3237 family protein [Sneathiella chungangensis]|uniref:UPF0311 protein GQF03_12305 n=1 Tax=Sneathiella chungangensis TaxID=1418234 RepID=A0A845MI70_9PROT|nr:DUF3237 domain-containing protein [Sneathiella chungangensis]MZR23110.1 DUF3237 family protein [Sneathiella chungangensis]
MSDIKLTHAFDMQLSVKSPVLNLGKTPQGGRLIAEVTGGVITGPLLNGRVHAGGADWLLLREDDVMQLDVRITIEAEDGGLIYARYEGLRHGPQDVMAKMAAGETVDPSLFYFRILPRFETSAASHLWLNKHLFVGTGERNSEGPKYSVFKVE